MNFTLYRIDSFIMEFGAHFLMGERGICLSCTQLSTAANGWCNHSRKPHCDIARR
jgi:hypothetical protein